MVQHLPVARIKGPAAFTQIVGGCRQIIRSVDGWHPPQFPHRSLKSGDEGLEALRATDHAGLPVRVRQDKVIEEVLEGLAIQRDAQRPHGGKIALRIFARAMNLRKHHLPIRPVDGPPAPDPALQRAKLALGQGHLGASPQGLEDCGGLESRSLDQQRLNLRPQGRKGIGARPILAGNLALTGERARPVPPRRVLTHACSHGRC